MGFSVKKSMVFLVAILVLLLCRCSCADDHFPHVRAGDRKLLAVPFGSVFKQAGRSTSRAVGSQSDNTLNELTKKVVTQFGVKNTGESIATKLYGGRDGLRSFKIGWKAGKRIYSIEKRCEELQVELTAAELTVYPRCTKNCSSKFCVTTMIENAVLNLDECYGSNQQLQGTPCTYKNGNIYDSANNRVVNGRLTCPVV